MRHFLVSLFAGIALTGSLLTLPLVWFVAGVASSTLGISYTFFIGAAALDILTGPLLVTPYDHLLLALISTLALAPIRSRIR